MTKSRGGTIIIASAIVLAALTIGCALLLRGTPYADGVNSILVAGMVVHLLLIWPLLRKK
ncbi:MAG TPA: hypothetical protein ENN19_15300 [Chloroflexi bacterium]|nr:hypothetical protein [Chloroflexota bacterium]